MTWTAWALALALMAPAEPEPGVERAKAGASPLRAELLSDGNSNYQPTVDYGLEARLDPATHQVLGRGRVRWTHRGSTPVRSLWWHLYLNAFRNTRSTYLLESGGGHRSDRRKDGDFGFIEVTRMQARLPDGGEVDLLAGRTWEHPDDDNADDRTVMRTPLPFAVAPGETVEVGFEWRAQLPQVFARSGYKGSFHMVAQWFPKLGVLQESFRPGAALDAYGEPAWNCHQLHAHSEFFADYGRYRVAITVPEGWEVGATGRRVQSSPGADGAITHEYAQEAVHDFAWAADRRFVRLTRRFTDAEVTPGERAEAAALLDLSQEDLHLSDVEVTALLQPEHAQYADRYFAAVFAGLKWFGLWYGAYPYPVLTLVDGPRGSGGAMGMEYPTLITGGVAWPAPARGPSPEAVTVHELGHQFWYGLVGTNEFEEAWLDEGFNTYSTGRALDRAYGPFVMAPRVLGVPLSPWLARFEVTQEDVFRFGLMASPDRDQVVRDAWRYLDSRSYGVNVYPRSGAVLSQLEVQLGARVMAQAMRLYHLRWRYRHPTTQDFIEVVEEASGRDLQAFFQRTLFTPGKVEYGIESLQSRRQPALEGMVEGPGAAPGALPVAQGEGWAEGPWETEVLVVRHGDVPFAHGLEVRFTDGSTRSALWDGRYRWQRFRFTGDAEAVSARLYPDAPMVLDASPANDTWVREAPDPGVTWGATALYALQTLLDLLGSLL
jgi:hypothetical protein